MNSLPNKFDQLKLLIQGNIDILIVTESKLDSSFPDCQFKIDGFSKPFRKDRNRNGGGVIIFVREDIPCKELSFDNPNDFESIFLEINLRHTKWLLSGCYHPPSQSDDYFFYHLGNSLDHFSKKYDNFLLAGDFNSEETESVLSEFLQIYDAKNIVKDKTCFKSTVNPSCIDLFLTNKPRSFQNTTVLNIGISDHHKMVITVLKSNFKKGEPKCILYRDYSNFNENLFKDELKLSLTSNKIYDYTTFETTFLQILNTNAPMKKKIVRANHAPYITKALRKAIMHRTKLETKYRKVGTVENFKAYKKHKNFCSRLYKKERKKYYSSLDIKSLTDNKKFWSTMKPFLSNKVNTSSKITLVENESIISNDNDVASAFQNFFDNAVSSLNLSCDNAFVSETTNFKNPIDIAIEKFKNHPSIIAIKNNVSLSHLFHFDNIEGDAILKEINDLDSKKNGTHNDIPAKCLKLSSLESGPYLTKVWNEEVVKNGIFPNELKLADVSPVFKKNDSTQAKNYRPVSVLPTVSKVFERLMQKQISNYIDQFLSSNLCGYRKGYSTQSALTSLLEKWKSILDNKGYAGAVLMDLSKAFDTINHELLLAKLSAYGFSKQALVLVSNYLSNRLQHVKINSSFSTWSELLQGVPQGSVLGPLLFNIYLNDLFFLLKDIDVCNFADDTTPFVCDINLETVLIKLETNSEIAIAWFDSNYMKLNTEKCHLIVSGHRYEEQWVKIGEDKIWEEKSVKLLGVTIDNELKFDSHVKNICLKANMKLSALLRLNSYLSFEKKRILYKAFVESQFKYCSLSWMFHSRYSNNKINRLHERALRLVYDDFVSSFDELLTKDKSFSIHHQNLQRLMIEIFKSINKENPSSYFDQLFVLNNNCTRSSSNKDLVIPPVKTVLKGQNSLKYLGSLIWNSVPYEIKNLDNLEAFKNKIKNWKPENCPCRLCKTFFPGVGFVQVT